MTVDEAKEAIKSVIEAWASTVSLALSGLEKKINLTGGRVSGHDARIAQAEARIELLERRLDALTRQPSSWLQ